MIKNAYKEKLEKLAEQVTSRDDLHEAYKKKMQEILLQFAMDLAGSELFVEDLQGCNISLACLREYAKSWVEKRFKKEF